MTSGWPSAASSDTACNDVAIAFPPGRAPVLIARLPEPTSSPSSSCRRPARTSIEGELLQHDERRLDAASHHAACQRIRQLGVRQGSLQVAPLRRIAQVEAMRHQHQVGDACYISRIPLGERLLHRIKLCRDHVEVDCVQRLRALREARSFGRSGGYGSGAPGLTRAPLRSRAVSRPQPGEASSPRLDGQRHALDLEPLVLGTLRKSKRAPGKAIAVGQLPLAAWGRALARPYT